MVKIVKLDPHHSVVKEVVCRGCGATLEYVPNEIKTYVHHDYGGGSDLVKYIGCPNCGKEINVS